MAIAGVTLLFGNAVPDGLSLSGQTPTDTRMPQDSSGILLPEPRYDGSVSVEKALKGRRSIRAYAEAPLSLSEISQILWAAYGITFTSERMPPFLRGGLKTAPSAGALYPLEIYLAAGSVEGLDPGVYRYLPDGHRLIPVSSGDVRQDLSSAALNQSLVKAAPAVLVYSAVFSRTTGKYGDRGRQRYVCMDLGHSAQNVYLQAFTLEIGTCAVGAFNDEAVKKVIGMPEEEEPLYIMPLGKIQ
jgi:SagB-type dehydrogenase family enzyme